MKAMTHLLLFLFLLASLAGTAVVVITVMQPEFRRSTFLRAYAFNVLFYNLLVLGGLFYHYSLLHMATGTEETGAPFPAMAILLLLAVLKIAWLGAVWRMTLALAERPLPRRSVFYFILAGISLVGVLGLFFMTDLAGQATSSFGAAAWVVEVLVLVGALLAAGWLLVRNRQAGGTERRSGVARFGGYHLLFFGCMMAGLFIGTLPLSVPPEFYRLFFVLVMLLYNILPARFLLKNKRLLLPRSDRLDAPAGLPPRLLRQYRISRREAEILQQVMSGRTNQEIADALCISLQTVKDHNRSIFRKTGVRNRVELVNLFREDGGGQ
jgi:DNA-binding CsgD family transcriptional regulator